MRLISFRVFYLTMAKNFINKTQGNFTIVQNEILNSTLLSFEEKGLYTYLISKPDGWNFSSSGIQTDSKEKLGSIKRMLKSLENTGLLIRHKVKNSSGQFTGIVYEITDKITVSQKTANGKTTDGNSIDCKTSDGKTTDGKPTNISNTINNNTDIEILNNNNTDIQNEFFEKNSPEDEIRYLWENFKGKRNTFEKDLNNFIEKTKGLNVDFKKLRSELNKTKDVYFQTWVNKKFPKATKSKTNNISGEKVQSLHQIIIDVYSDWFKQRNDGIVPKIDGAEAKAAKMIAEYFKTIQAKKEPNTTEEEMPEKIKNMALYIFSKWDTLEVFLQKQVKLTQINSNITNIINFIKNGKQATNNNNYNKQPVTNDTITERFKYFSEFFDRE